MSLSRLETAQRDGAFAWPDGPVWLVETAPDLWMPPGADLHVTHGFKPALDKWLKRGAAQGAPDAPGLAVMSVPRSKTLARALVVEAARAPFVVIDGQKTDGVDSLHRALRGLGAATQTLTKGHGRVFWFAPDKGLRERLEPWRSPGPQQADDGFFRQPGVFSETRIDPGSAGLAAVLPDKPGRRIVDLGAGWGHLSHAIMERGGVEQLHLVEADARALDCARLLLKDEPRITFHWADARTFRLPDPVDTVVMNPPFHEGRTGAPDLGQAFIDTAAALLSPRGTLWMVANRHLPYEDALSRNFRAVQELEGTSAFKLFRAERPSRR